MKFSFFMMPIHHPSENPSLAFQRDISFIHLADELGFDEFFIGEHHSGGWENMPVPEMALSMAAAKAHRIRLGTSVTLLPYHHPFQVAERIAFLDHLTKGRAILGIGPSTLVSDKRLFAIPEQQNTAMMYESVEIIVRLLEAEEPISYQGEFWRFEDMRLQLRSYQQPRLPLAVATGGTAKTLDMVGRHGMQLWSNAGRHVRRPCPLVEQWPQVEAAATAAGREATRDDWSLVTNIYLAETREQAWADVSDGIMRETEYFATIGLKFLYEAHPGQPFADFTPQSCVEQRDWIIGTPDDAIAWIDRKQEETGGFGGMMITTHEWTTTDKLQRSIELFARYVMPRFRGHTQGHADDWEKLERDLKSGEFKLNKGEKPSNLARAN